MKKSVFKVDKFKKARGGYSRLLDIRCAKCDAHVCFYQKDGPGILKRMYIDRMLSPEKYQKYSKLSVKNIPQLTCHNCNEHLGVPMIYKKETRLAYGLFVGSVKKEISKVSDLAQQ